MGGERTALLNALRDLTDFVEADEHAELPQLAWRVAGTPVPTVEGTVLLGPEALRTVLAYCNAINVPPMVKRDHEKQQSVIAYRRDAVNGRTEMYVSVRNPIDCLIAPPTHLTVSALLAEREWATRAKVRFLRDVTDSTAPDAYPRTSNYRKGDERIMVQHGHQHRPVRPDWWSSFDIDGAWIAPADAIEIVELISYTSPCTPWPETAAEQIAGYSPRTETWSW
jgi:hypothetical protein